jgi:hypothetical protein
VIKKRKALKKRSLKDKIKRQNTAQKKGLNSKVGLTMQLSVLEGACRQQGR